MASTSWRIDDMDGGLDGGLASELLNLSGLGNEYGAEGAYNMRYGQNLCQLMKKKNSVLVLLLHEVGVKIT